MPFAVVEGQPITEMPRDLYIPPQALEVFLEAFEGPLDMLLYLIRRQNLDILDIPIAEITRQYMRYIELMQVLQLELAGEYLLMAATLAEVKSRMLLPRVGSDESAEEADPRAELVRRLQEYERFKRAAEGIDRMPRLERDTWVASADLVDRKVVRMPPQVTLQEMLLAFQEVLSRSDMFAHHHVQREPLSVRQRMTDVLSSLTASAFVDFVQLFRPDEGRRGRDGDLRRHPGTAARRVDRNSAGGSLRAAARTPRQSGPAPQTGGRRRGGQRRNCEYLMNDQYVKNVVEAALLAAGRPLTMDELVSVFDERDGSNAEEVRGAIAALTADYETRGLELLEVASGYRIQIRAAVAQPVSRLWQERPAKYSRALLETLALVAYRQPITRGEIEQIRGVAVNPNIIKTLLERSWIRVVGHRDVPGKPELLGTTREFLDYFSLKKLDDLPTLAQLKELEDLRVQLTLPGADPQVAARKRRRMPMRSPTTKKNPTPPARRIRTACRMPRARRRGPKGWSRAVRKTIARSL